jgi:uncharacterized protein (DUF433 family)
MKAAENIGHIVRDEQGTAWIDGKNVKVVEIVLDHLAYGWSADAIHDQHPDLSLAEIHSALAFYYDHIPELEAQIAEQEKKLEVLRRATGRSSIQERLRRAKNKE